MNNEQKLKQALQELDALKLKIEWLMSCEDKFAELKEAHENGAVIEVKSNLDGKWYEIDPLWFKDQEYRIKHVSQFYQDIESLKNKYPQYRFNITVEDKV